MSLCNLSCIFVYVYIVLELLLDLPGLAPPLSESEDDESEKLDSRVTGLTTSHDGEDDEDNELDS